MAKGGGGVWPAKCEKMSKLFRNSKPLKAVRKCYEIRNHYEPFETINTIFEFETIRRVEISARFL